MSKMSYRDAETSSEGFRKDAVDAMDDMAGELLAQIEDRDDEINALEDEVEALTKEVDTLQSLIDGQSEQIKDLERQREISESGQG